MSTPTYLRGSIAGAVALAFFAGTVLACTPGPRPQRSTPAPSPVATATAAAEITRTVRIDQRTVDLTVQSPALGQAAKVRLLLPRNFGRDRRRWPVLFLLHGCCDSYLSWTRSTDVEQLTTSSDLLVVMPDGGAAGFYSNWRTGPQWETFHLAELPRLLEQRYQAGNVWAIAGNSMGGLGALGYAARHPDLFKAAASFSGIVHTTQSEATARNYLGLVASQGEPPDALWGDPITNGDVWSAHNPYDLAERLVGIPLFLSVGDGRPGPLDEPGASDDGIEAALAQENVAFRDRLTEVGADVTVDFYGAGLHDWPYWQRELRVAWPIFQRALDLS